MRTIFKILLCVLIFTCTGICRLYSESNSESKLYSLSASKSFEFNKEYYAFKDANENELSFTVFNSISVAPVAVLYMQPNNRNDFLFLLHSYLNPLLLDIPPPGISVSNTV